VFLNGLEPRTLDTLYSFVERPAMIEPLFLGAVDLAVRSIPLALLAGALQFLQSRMILPRVKLLGAPKRSDEMMAQMISRQTLYLLPVLTVVFAWNLPAGLPLYWSVTTLFTIAQQFVIMRSQKWPQETTSSALPKNSSTS
jgi:YidC/Oxa1 family membrane protein insertase